MDSYNIILFQPFSTVTHWNQLDCSFNVVVTHTIDQCRQLICEKNTKAKAIVIDFSCQEKPDFSIIEQLLDGLQSEHFPIIVASETGELQYKLKAYELGCDDYIENTIATEEVTARVNKAIYSYIASEQLKSRLQLANDTTYTVMSDASDLGSNIQFLLNVNHCDNLDQLGQLFFTMIERYGLSCSLQMRSLYEIKNMDASGLAPELESQLLERLKGAGRYIDFGCRSVVNYGQVSLLVRNMPVDDEKKYGVLKDNTFSLVQGINARLKAIDGQTKLLEEKKSLHQLSCDVQMVMGEIENAYQAVMKDIVNIVEDMAESIMHRIPTLALSEEQESFFENVASQCVADTNRVFNAGLKVDESFQRLSDSLQAALSLAENEPEDCELSEKNDCDLHGNDIHLF